MPTLLPWLDRRRGFLLLAAAVLVAGFFVRAWGLFDRGLLLFDEGVYLCQARYVAGAIRSVPDALRHGWLAHVRGEAAQAPARVELRTQMATRVEAGMYPAYPKDTHCLLIALVFLTLGDADWAGHAVGLVFGVLTIGLVGVLGRSLYGDAAGVLAALALALSPLHLMLSRHSLAEADSIFFLVAAVALVRAALADARSPLRVLFFAGLATGLCFTSNFRNAIAPAIVWCAYGAGLLADRRPLGGLRFRGLTWLCVGMLLPLVAWEAAYLTGQWLLGQPYGRFPTYFQLVLHWILIQGAPEVGTGDWSSLPFFLREYVGWPVLLLAVVGGGVLVRARSLDGLYIALPLVWVIGFFELRTRQQCLRYLGPALPFLALAAGAALRVRGGSESEAGVGVVVGTELGAPAGGARPGPTPGAAWATRCSWAAAGAVLVGAVLGPWEWLGDRSGLPQVFALLRAHREKGECRRYFCQETPFALYYDPPVGHCEPLPETLAALQERVRQGTRYLVVTSALLRFYRLPDYFLPLLREAHQRSTPMRVPHPAGGLPYLAYEHNMFGQTDTLADTRKAADALAQSGGTVWVYDLLWCRPR
ncbi:MAG: glycosyltransferase family 39 protein [Planctomycetes bacterium]|nr:glycosyltransferase family 39 protein [Planctomycetota bacterium]